jgi:hypothetical protein
MSGFYRFGKPGEDRFAHINTGRRSTGSPCKSPRFPEDNSQCGEICGRLTVALCDCTGCNAPMCELHRTRHPTLRNTDFCPKHAHLAQSANERKAQPVENPKKSAKNKSDGVA